MRIILSYGNLPSATLGFSGSLVSEDITVPSSSGSELGSRTIGGMFEFCLYVSLVKEKLLTVDETNHFKGKARVEGLYKANHALEL